MNDRFRFRAWIKKYKRMVDVFRYGNDMGTCEWIWHSHIYDTPDGKPVLDNWGSVDERFSNIIERTKLIDCVLEQCTGLKDKNGQLIYEGDILDFDLSNPRNGGHYRGFVYWERHNELIGWMISDMEQIGAWDLRQIAHPNDWMVWGEIIGNIHENTELLDEND